MTSTKAKPSPQTFEGSYANYRVLKSLSSNEPGPELLGQGASADALLAEVIEVKRPGQQLAAGKEVVIKNPKLGNDLRPQSYRENTGHLLELTRKFLSEWMTYHYLEEGLKCVSRVLDYGYLMINLTERLTVPIPFTVHEYVDGKTLGDYLPEVAGTTRPEFRGIKDSKEFLTWASGITKALIRVHQRQVIHGDIWQNNIMVPKGEPRPVFIDFGQALFRDLVVGFGGGSTGPWTPPGGNESVAGDIFGLGQTFLYMAIGQLVGDDGRSLPVPGLVGGLDADQLKDKIVTLLEQRNPILYRDCHGVADIIARCLRSDPHKRPLTAEQVLRDIELFCCEEPESDYAPPVGLAERLEFRPFKDIAAWGFRRLALAAKDMEHGCYDLVGDHQDIVVGMARFVSVLKQGDKYLTASVPSFWHTGNLGVNGRFLSANYDAARRGVEIRRIFVITEDELRDDLELETIIKSQQRVVNDLSAAGVAGDKKDGYFAGYRVVRSSDERARAIGETGHFGLFITKEGTEKAGKMLLAPEYNSKGEIVAIQFRTALDLVECQMAQFEILLAESRALGDFFSDPDVQRVRTKG